MHKAPPLGFYAMTRTPEESGRKVRELVGMPLAEMIARDTSDGIGLRAQWHALTGGRSVTGDPWDGSR